MNTRQGQGLWRSASLSAAAAAAPTRGTAKATLAEGEYIAATGLKLTKQQ